MEILFFKFCFAIFLLWINSCNNMIIEITVNGEPSTIIFSTDTITNSTTGETSVPSSEPRKIDVEIERNVQDELVLNCTDVAIKNRANKITWIKDNNVTLDNFENKWSMRVSNVQMNDTGEYTCIMESNSSSFDFTFKVLVYESPEMIIKPENITLMVGESGSFMCRSSSKIPSYMEWYPGVNLNEMSSMLDLTQEQYDNFKMNVNNPEVFEVQKVALADQGWYSCLARNGLNTLNASAYLKVIENKDEEYEEMYDQNYETSKFLEKEQIRISF